jgi:DNA-directed RNA polymerase specialized sigma24 family protein
LEARALDVPVIYSRSDGLREGNLMNKDEEKVLTDLALRAARGDEDAFHTLWTSPLWINRVKAICYHICRLYPLPGGDLQEDSKDLAQNACLRMMRKRELFSSRNGASVSTWFTCIARNIHHKEFRKRESGAKYLRESRCQLKGCLSDQIPDAALRLKEELRKLTPRERNILRLQRESDSVMEVAQNLYAEEWPAMSEHERKKATHKVYRELKKMQKVLVEAVDGKELAAPPHRKGDFSNSHD